jgi:hypothetical protein
MVKLWSLRETYKQKKTTQKARTLKRGANGQTPEPPKTSKVIPKSGAPFVIGKWIVCDWVLSFKQVQALQCSGGNFPGLLLSIYRGVQRAKKRTNIKCAQICVSSLAL